MVVGSKRRQPKLAARILARGLYRFGVLERRVLYRLLLVSSTIEWGLKY
jgi:hypothetical protein